MATQQEGEENQNEGSLPLNYQKMCDALTHTGFLPDDKPEMEAIDQ